MRTPSQLGAFPEEISGSLLASKKICCTISDSKIRPLARSKLGFEEFLVGHRCKKILHFRFRFPGFERVPFISIGFVLRIQFLQIAVWRLRQFESQFRLDFLDDEHLQAGFESRTLLRRKARKDFSENQIWKSPAKNAKISHFSKLAYITGRGLSRALCDVPFEAFIAVTLVQIRQSVSRNFLSRFRPPVVVGGHPLTLHLFPLSSIVKTI